MDCGSVESATKERDSLVQQNMMHRMRMAMPARAALAQVVEELVKAPPTDEQLRMLADIGKATDTLVVEKVEAQLEGTRILELLRILLSNITVAECIIILIMIS
jgi:ethanolamine ammonia-lyase small subunit